MNIANARTACDLVRSYLAHLSLRRAACAIAQATIATRRRYLGDFLTRVASTPLHELRQTDLTEWFAERLDRWKSNYTRRDALTSVLACFQWAEEEELIDRNPFRWPRGLRLHLKPRKAITASAYATILRRCTNRSMRRALYFLRNTGARTCEMRNLTWGDIDWQLGIIRLSEHKTAHVTGEDRLIGLTDKVMGFLRRLAARQGREGHVFRNSDGKPWNKDTFARCFRRWADRAGVPKAFSAYGIRHFFATQAIKNGVTGRQLADQLGHRSTRMVDRYAASTREDAEHLREVARAATRRK